MSDETDAKKSPEPEDEQQPAEQSLPYCTTAASAEHARADEEDEPCDDSRGVT